jgi:hypothetical protein
VADSTFEDLLARMPDIAAAIKGLPEAIQSQAFQALIDAFHGETTTAGSRVAGRGSTDQDDSPASPRPTRRVGRKKASSVAVAKAPAKKSVGRGKQSFSMVKDVDFVKGADVSFKDFVEEKAPGSQVEKVLIAVYWLSRRAAISPVTIDHVYTAFKTVSWPVPADLANKLSQAGTKGWLDSRSRDDLKVVVGGENHVEHDMPARSKKA